MKRVVLTFGFISGAILSIMMLATIPFMDRIGFDKGAVIGYTTMVVAFLMIFFGIRSYRDNVASGDLTFGRAFKVGILIAVIASVCYVATWEVIYYTIMPDFGEKYTAHVIEKQKAAGATEAALAASRVEMTKMMDMYKNPLFNVGMTFLEVFPIGLVITLISAAILRRRRVPELVPAR